MGPVLLVSRCVEHGEGALGVRDVGCDPRIEQHRARRQRVGDEGGVGAPGACASWPEGCEIRLPALTYEAAHPDFLSAGWVLSCA